MTVIAFYVFLTFTSIVIFVVISVFHTKIADPVIEGICKSFFQLHNVDILHFAFILYLDLQPSVTLTLKSVMYSTMKVTYIPLSNDIKSFVTLIFLYFLKAEKYRCINSERVCKIEEDGYYIICVIVGTVSFWIYICPAAMKLQALKLNVWRLDVELGRRQVMGRDIMTQKVYGLMNQA